MPESDSVSRRTFLERSATTAAVTLVSRHVLGGPRHVPPSDRINVGYVGCGTQGLRQLMPALQREDLRITAVCDPNRRSEDYVEWSRFELRDKIRAFLKDPTWAEGAKACPGGREVGRELVDRHYGASPGGGCHAYADFRELLAKEKDLDAVYIMTPDHLHATIALAAMKAGKHVIVHKPLGNVLHEARLVIQTARETGAATHMFCSAGLESTAQITEWIEAGAIGPVREVHNWSSRPFWPQGMTSLPAESVPVPDGLDWDLWLGPVPHRPYHPAYTNAVFRGWYDFGTGALGDMGHYSLLPGLQDPEARLAPHGRGEPQPVLEDRRPPLEEAGQHGLLSRTRPSSAGSSPSARGCRPSRSTGTTAACARRSRASSRRTASRCPRRGSSSSATAGRSWASFIGAEPAAHPEGEDAGLPAPAADAAPAGRGARAVGPRLPGHGPVGRQLRERGGHQRDDPAGHDRACASRRSCGGTRRARGSSTLRRPTR